MGIQDLCKKENTIDNRIHSRVVGGRWIKHQKIDLATLTDDIYKISWTKLIETDANISFMPKNNRLHGMILFPKWVYEHLETTSCLQYEFIPLKEESRQKSSIYLKYVASRFTPITDNKNAGLNNENIISETPYQGMIDNIKANKLNRE